jgi:hypothetical protein
MRHLFFDILLIVGFSVSFGMNIVQYYAVQHIENMYFKQCGTSIIAVKEEIQLNKMFDMLESNEGGEK